MIVNNLEILRDRIQEMALGLHTEHPHREQEIVWCGYGEDTVGYAAEYFDHIHDLLDVVQAHVKFDD